jgi:shikimate kinase
MAGHLWLIGMMGAGKSTVGRLVAERCDARFTDSDDAVVAHAGWSIPELWERSGERAFRDMEAAAVERLAEASEPLVIATGGGVVLRPENVSAMRRSGRVVWLAADPSTLAARVGDGADRPLLAGSPAARRLADLLAERADAYAAAADVVISTDDRDARDVADEVEAAWAHT